MQKSTGLAHLPTSGGNRWVSGEVEGKSDAHPSGAQARAEERKKGNKNSTPVFQAGRSAYQRTRPGSFDQGMAATVMVSPLFVLEFSAVGLGVAKVELQRVVVDHHRQPPAPDAIDVQAGRQASAVFQLMAPFTLASRARLGGVGVPCVVRVGLTVLLEVARLGVVCQVPCSGAAFFRRVNGPPTPCLALLVNRFSCHLPFVRAPPAAGLPREAAA